MPKPRVLASPWPVLWLDFSKCCGASGCMYLSPVLFLTSRLVPLVIGLSVFFFMMKWIISGSLNRSRRPMKLLTQILESWNRSHDNILVVTFVLSHPDSSTWERTITHICSWKPRELVYCSGLVSFSRISDCGASNQPIAMRPLLSCTPPKNSVCRPTDLLHCECNVKPLLALSWRSPDWPCLLSEVLWSLLRSGVFVSTVIDSSANPLILRTLWPPDIHTVNPHPSL